MKIYHQLGLDTFFKNKARHESFKFNTNSIMILLVASRLLSPGSKKKAFEERHRRVGNFAFSNMSSGVGKIARKLVDEGKVKIEADGRHYYRACFK